MKKSIKETSNERWTLAQDAEKGFWGGLSEDFVHEHSKQFIKKAEILTVLFSNYKKITPKTKFLQVGCAGYDVINFLKTGQKYSIDPLADFYKTKFNFDYDKTHFIQGVGENLPYENKTFDIILLANVLDHTKDPMKVLSEIKRVLKDDGILYFENNFYQKSFLVLSFFYSVFKMIFHKEIFNICHPYMFSIKRLKKILSSQFELIYEEKLGKDIERDINNMKELRDSVKKEKLKRRKIPAYFGLLGTIIFTAIYKKKN